MEWSSAPGMLVGGRFRLVRVLAAGGMGQVWEARDELLATAVAVKEVRPEEGLSADDRERAVARAMAEARHAAALRDHPNIVAVHDVVVADGGPWMVMRLVRGRSLAQALRTDGPLDRERAAEVATGVLRALAAAHRAGIVHRDVKPSNIMLADGGGVLLADFGIAKNHAGTVLTTTGIVLGSLDYLAPERLAQEPDTPAVDLFSLGATLYEAVEGVSPFRRETPATTIAAIALAHVPPPRRAGRLAPLITALLSRDPAGRPDAEAGLAMLAGSGPAAEHTPTERDLPAAPASALTLAPSRSGWLRGPRARIALAAAVAVVCASVLSWAVLRDRGDSDRNAGAPAASSGPSSSLPSTSSMPSAPSAPGQDTATTPDAGGNAVGPAVADDQHVRIFTAPESRDLLESYVDLRNEAAKLQQAPGAGRSRVVDYRLASEAPTISGVLAGTAPVALLDPQHIVRVFFVDSGTEHLSEARLEPGKNWQVSELGNRQIRSTPTAAVLDGEINVFTADADNHLRRTYLDSKDKKANWDSQDLQTQTDLLNPNQHPTAPVAAGTAPVAVVAGRFLRVYTITADNRLQESSLEPGKGWNIFTPPDTPQSVKTPTAVVHEGVTSVFTVNRTDGHLSETRLTPSRQSANGPQDARWSLHDLTGEFRVPAPRSAPAALLHGGTTSLFAVDGNGRLTETRATGDGWTPQDSLANAGVQPVAADTEPAAVDQGGVTRVYTTRRSDGKLQETTLRTGTWTTEAVVED
ncbi:serine/threonine-protein kinase [Kitasatospora cineracea]|uniref:serine/threonine-protein kinase n=1 Tax=Kitasatospora cineracea TaxID=88074 RepID=UPI003437FCBB